MITAPTRVATGRDTAAWRATDLERDTARWTLHYDDCRHFDAEQAQAMGMALGPRFSD